jgi:hypothetical protein
MWSHPKDHPLREGILSRDARMDAIEATSPEPFPHKWAFEPLRQGLYRLDKVHWTLRLSMAGVSMVVGLPNALQALEPYDKAAALGGKSESARRLADAAKEEMDSGFPLLYSQALTSLWEILETTMRSFLAGWLANEPKAMLVPQVQGLHVVLGRYEGLSFEARQLYIVDLLERETLACYNHGPPRFEVLLKLFGLSNPLDKERERNLLELHHLRDAFLYRDGLVDRKLNHACPWLELETGKPITISYQDCLRLMDSAQEYVMSLMGRVAAYYGLGQEEAQ